MLTSGVYCFIIIQLTFMTYLLQAAPVNVKIGILHDSDSTREARLVEQTLGEITTSDFKFQTLLYSEEANVNQTEFLFNSNITAILSVATELNCGAIQTTKKLFPFFSVARSLDSCDRNDDHDSITYLFPSNFALISALNKTTNHYKWKNAVVLEKQNKEIQFGFSDLQFTREQGIETSAFEATEDESSLISTLKMARKEGLRTYILTSSTVSALHIMKQAEIMQLTTDNFHWFIPNVFVDPESFPGIARNGARLTSLSSPVITPLVRRLLSSYNTTGLSQEQQQLNIYDDVIKYLTRLAIDVIVRSCRNNIAESATEIYCKPLLDEVDHMAAANILSLRGTNQYVAPRRKREVDSEPHHTSSCAFPGTRVASCKQISACYSQGENRGHREAKMVSVIKSVTTQDDVYRSKRSMSTPSDLQLTQQTCPTFNWTGLLTDLGIENDDDGKSKFAINYNSSVDLCRYYSSYNWAYKPDSFSHNLMKGMELAKANSILVQEYSKHDKVPLTVGVYNWDKPGEFRPMYHPFTLQDITLPNRPMRVCAVWHHLMCGPENLFFSINLGLVGSTLMGKQGFLYDVLGHLSKQLNFTYVITIPPYFASKPHASEDEIENMMYEVFENGTCDFFLHTKSIRGGSLGQSKTIEASLAYQQPSMFLLTERNKKTESISIWQFMTPFREESWICLWSSFILISLFLAWINKNNPYEYEKIAPSFGPNSSPSDHLGVLNSLWFTFSSIVQQGIAIVPRSRAAKALTGTWWFFGLTIITAYTANMTLFMTQGNKGMIKTLDALSKQKEFVYGILEDDPILTLFLPHAKERPYTVIYNFLKRNWNTTVFANQKDAFARIQSGNFYLLSSFETVVDALSISCSYDKVGTGFYQYQFALPFPKGSLILPLFNDCIARLRDTGILTMLEEQWFSVEARCEESSTSSTLENQLDIKAFTGMYVFLIIGCGIGGIFCLIETCWVQCGGIRGLYGNARQYELTENRREHRKNLDLLEKEFEGWEGGWNVWKFKEWTHDDLPKNINHEEHKKQLKMKVEIEKTTEARLDKCGLCGKRKKEKMVAAQAAFVSALSAHKEGKQENKKTEPNVADSGRSSVASGVITDIEDTEAKSNSQIGILPNLSGVEYTSDEPAEYTTQADVHPHPLPLAPPMFGSNSYPDAPLNFSNARSKYDDRENISFPEAQIPRRITARPTTPDSIWSSTDLPNHSSFSDTTSIHSEMISPPRAFSEIEAPTKFADTFESDSDWTDTDDADDYDEYDEY